MRRSRLVYLIFILSGAAGLVYEIVWARQLVLVFGNTTQAVSAILTGFLLEYLSWRALFLFYALPGLLWAAWFFLWFRDRPQEHPAVNAPELEQIQGPLAAPRSEAAAERRERSGVGDTRSQRSGISNPKMETRSCFLIPDC